MPRGGALRSTAAGRFKGHGTYGPAGDRRSVMVAMTRSFMGLQSHAIPASDRRASNGTTACIVSAAGPAAAATRRGP